MELFSILLSREIWWENGGRGSNNRARTQQRVGQRREVIARPFCLTLSELLVEAALRWWSIFPTSPGPSDKREIIPRLKERRGRVAIEREYIYVLKKQRKKVGHG